MGIIWEAGEKKQWKWGKQIQSSYKMMDEILRDYKR